MDQCQEFSIDRFDFQLIRIEWQPYVHVTRGVYTILQTFGYLSLFLKLFVKSFVTFIAFLIFIISFKIYEFVRVVKEWVRSKELINYKKSRIKIYRLKKNFILYYSIKVLLF